MNYNELVVWQKSMNLVTSIYRVSAAFPSDERFGLISQIRRAAVSIPSNIAEGHGRKSTGAYIQHLSIAHGFLMELETQVQISCRLDFIKETTMIELLAVTAEIGKMLSALKKSLSTREQQS